jgi:hypothetical protein
VSVRRRRSRALSDAQLRMLRAVKASGNPCDGLSGRSAHGGATCTLSSLQRKSLLRFDTVTDGWVLTAAGDVALAEGFSK